VPTASWPRGEFMAEPSIIREQREVVRAVRSLADQHAQEEAEAESRLRLDHEAADAAFSQARRHADGELRQAYELLQEAERVVQPRPDRAPRTEIAPTQPPTMFDTDLLIGMRITTAQMEARMIRIRASLDGGSAGNMITVGIILGGVVAAGAILVVPFVLGTGTGGWNMGLFGAMLSPLLIAILIAAARATFLRPYSPDDDYLFIRESMGYVMFMHQVVIEEARSTFDRRLNERQERFEETKERIAQSFRQQLALMEPKIAKFSTAASTIGPEWVAPSWRTWSPSTQRPRTTCVGEMLSGIREDRLTLPALIPFPHEKALIVTTDSHGRDRAISVIRSVLLRLVATVPPGDLRFILVDPVGQGKNVAPFTPFADRGVGLGEGRAWTEPSQIEQRLNDLLSLVDGAAEANAFHALMPHMDSSRANGVAEPCRVLVVLDFPTHISGTTARTLASIIQKGPSHGVHPIILVDTEQPVPYGVNLPDLEQHATTLAWDGRRFVWQDPDFRTSWIEFDKPPRAELARKILSGVQRPIRRTA
jgi:hypothetical protein